MATNDNKGIKFSNISAFKEESDKVYIANDKAQNLSDAAKVQAQNNMLGKAYAPAQHSGLGKVYLDKNNGVLTQSMISAANTVYVIQYDYTMSGNITIPAGCTLEFDGGSISGSYTLTGNATVIKSDRTRIFSLNTIIEGTWNISVSYPEWFDGSSDVDNINKAIQSFESVELLPKSYHIDKVDSENYAIRMPAHSKLKGAHQDNNTSKVASFLMVDDGVDCLAAIHIEGTSCTIEDLSIRTASVNNRENAGIDSVSTSKAYLNNVSVSGGYYGFNLALYLSYITKCTASYNKVGFYIHGRSGVQNTSVNMNNCYAVDSRNYGYHIQYMTYSVLNSCAADGCGVPNSGTIDSSTVIGYPYYVENSDSICFNSCGCETALAAVYAMSAISVAFNNCNFMISKRPNVTLDSSFKLKNIVSVAYSTLVNLKDCPINISSELNDYYNYSSSLIQLYSGNSSNKMLVYNTVAQYLSIKLNNIKTIGQADLYKNLQYTNPTIPTNFREGNRPEFTEVYEKAYYVGFSYFNGTKPEWWNGSNWVDATGTVIP